VNGENTHHLVEDDSHPINTLPLSRRTLPKQQEGSGEHKGDTSPADSAKGDTSFGLPLGGNLFDDGSLDGIDRNPSAMSMPSLVGSLSQSPVFRKSGSMEIDVAEVDDPVPRLPPPEQVWNMKEEAMQEAVISQALQIHLENPGRISDDYTWGAKLGEGAFGTVAMATLKATGATRAVKTLRKNNENIKGKMHIVRKEIEICKMVDHPYVVRLLEIFEDKEHIHLVLELCLGGDLHAYLKARRCLKEPEAAMAMLQIIRGVFYLHAHFICHRDLKAANVLITAAENDATSLENRLRINDFGLSCTFNRNTRLKARVGSSTHMAPEVLRRNYNELCDVWSLGVILYHMLSKRLPFVGEDDEDIAAKVAKARFSFGKNWIDRSENSIELVTKLLAHRPEARIPLKDAMLHRWIADLCPRPSVHFRAEIINNLRGFRGLTKFKKAALSVIASALPESKVAKARKAFLELDTDYDGNVSLVEIQDHLSLIKPADADNSDVRSAAMTIVFQPTREDQMEDPTLYDTEAYPSEMDAALAGFSYTEFLAATFDRLTIDEKTCKLAFNVFDQNRDGILAKTELLSGRLHGRLEPEELDFVFGDLDVNRDGQIDFEEFKQMMRDGKGWHKCYSRTLTSEKLKRNLTLKRLSTRAVA